MKFYPKHVYSQKSYLFAHITRNGPITNIKSNTKKVSVLKRMSHIGIIKLQCWDAQADWYTL